MVFVWATLASTLAVGMETYFRREGDWTLWFIPPAILLNFFVFKMVTAAPTFILATAAFGAVNIIMRSVISQWVLGESVARGNGAAVLLLLLALFIGRLWK